MLSIIWSKKKGSLMGGGSCKGEFHDEQGLRILVKIANGNSKVVVKPIFRLNQTIQSEASSDHQTYCFLKSCHLCHRTLSLDKEVYMYRGDLGFCSVECRDRQIYLDEMKEIEVSTKKILTSFRQRRPRDGSNRCETSKLLEEFRQRRHPFSSQNSRVIFS